MFPQELADCGADAIAPLFQSFKSALKPSQRLEQQLVLKLASDKPQPDWRSKIGQTIYTGVARVDYTCLLEIPAIFVG